jgi:hypothetical protein
MVFDSLADERGDAGPSGPVTASPSDGSPRPGVPAAGPAIRHRHAAPHALDPDRGLRRAIAVVSGAIVVVLAALLGSWLVGGGAPPVAPRHRSAAGITQPSSAPSPTATAPARTVPGVEPTSPTTSPTVPTPTSTTLPVPDSGPVMTALQPSTGGVGEAVIVTGTGFYSPTGRIRATVGGQTAFVSCPDQTTCTLTIPPLTGTATADPVVIITDTGTSNPLTFTLS